MWALRIACLIISSGSFPICNTLALISIQPKIQGAPLQVSRALSMCSFLLWAFSPPVLYTSNSSHPVLCELWILSPQLRETSRLFGSLSLGCGLDTFSRQWVGTFTGLILFVSLLSKHRGPVLLFVKCPKSTVSYIFLLFFLFVFRYLRWEGKPCSCYFIIAVSRSSGGLLEWWSGNTMLGVRTPLFLLSFTTC